MLRYNLALAMIRQQDLNSLLLQIGRIRQFDQQSLAILHDEWRGTPR